MERPASELMDSISESQDAGMEETGIPQSPPAISSIEEQKEEKKRGTSSLFNNNHNHFSP